MITQLTGNLLEAELTEVVIDVHGVGYAVSIPISTYEKLPRPGGQVTLYTCLQPREDAWTLYGFASREERSFFKMLTGISGIGPKLALNALSALSVEVLSNAIAQGDVKSLSKINGIGKRSAERMILELKDKISITVNGAGTATGAASMQPSPIAADAIAALETLGFKRDAAAKTVNALVADNPDASVEQILRLALARLNS